MLIISHRLMAIVGVCVVLVLWLSAAPLTAQEAAQRQNNSVVLRLKIIDSSTAVPLAARVYLQRDSDGRQYHVRSADDNGRAIPYDKTRAKISREFHTAVSAHSCEADLPPGDYTVTVERGKEYLPAEMKVEVGGEPKELVVRLRRWVNLADEGWYSGETHVHRSLDELPTAMLADDLNVALPLVYWVTRGFTAPNRGDRNQPPPKPELIEVDPAHVIWPVNTEYEIFTMLGKRHTLGAVFALGHRTPLRQGAPPVGAIAQRVREERGLLELDKHNWPWSMVLVPVMQVDLYELTNNHMWRAPFVFKNFGEPPADYMQIEQDEQGFTERGWIDFTFQNYYALLDCGFRMRPTGGTASGVHPVPLGFGRVYVQTENGFSYEKWMAGLDAGHSFVTTGPLLTSELNGQGHGHTFSQEGQRKKKYRLTGLARSARPLSTIEIVSAGRVLARVKPENSPRAAGGFESKIDLALPVDSSTWFALRCYEPQADGRVRFAHTAPWHIDVQDRPLRPRRAEVQYLIDRVKAELARSRAVLPPAALEEYQQALATYREIAESAR